MKRYSYRAYPHPRQRRDLARLFGCCRYIYNKTVADRGAIYEAGLHLEKEPAPTKDQPERMRRVFEANRQQAILTYERSRKPWLKGVSSVALIQSMRDAETAFANFFASTTKRRKGPKIGYPRYKSRFSAKQSARFTKNGFRVDEQHKKVYIAKIGWIPLALSRPLPATPSSVTIIARSDGTYEASFVVEAPAPQLTHPDGLHAGIDLGLETFATIVYSDARREKISSPRHLKKANRRLKKAYRALSRKQGPDKRTGQKASQAWKDQKAKVARAHSQVRNARTDFTRKTARRLAGECTTIAVESLNIRGLARSGAKNAQGRGLRRSVHDAAWGSFLRHLEEYAPGRVYPVNPACTSQDCSRCHTRSGPKPLKVRRWTCQSCGADLDRDYNAAVNIMVAAGQVETLNARGGDVRLRRAGAGPDETGTHWSQMGMTA